MNFTQGALLIAECLADCCRTGELIVTEYVGENYDPVDHHIKEFVVTGADLQAALSEAVKLNRVRLRHALELLVGTDLRSYEIAKEVGFRDYRYFSDQFYREYGRMPTAHRKAMSAAPSQEKE